MLSAPQEVAGASIFHRGFVAAGDVSGRVTVATRTTGGFPRLIERSGDGSWMDLPLVGAFPSDGYASRAAISAAGNGALGVAWGDKAPGDVVDSGRGP